LNYTTVLNFLFLTLAGVLLIRAWRTGGFGMLAMMDARAEPVPKSGMAPHH